MMPKQRGTTGGGRGGQEHGSPAGDDAMQKSLVFFLLLLSFLSFFSSFFLQQQVAPSLDCFELFGDGLSDSTRRIWGSVEIMWWSTSLGIWVENSGRASEAVNDLQHSRRIAVDWRRQG